MSDLATRLTRLERRLAELDAPSGAAQVQRFVIRTVESYIRNTLPRYHYGVVDGDPNTATRTVAVRLFGLPMASPGFVYGTVAPRDGDHVRVFVHPRGDRYVDGILGRDVVSEIVDVVTPPATPIDRARSATARALQPDVVTGETVLEFESTWKYLQGAFGHTPGFQAAAFDDSAWSSGPAIFGTQGTCAHVPATDWDVATDLLVRVHIDVPIGTEQLEFTYGIDNAATVYLDGVEVHDVSHSGCATRTDQSFTVLAPPTGDVVVAVRCTDLGDSSFFDMRIVASVPGEAFAPAPAAIDGDDPSFVETQFAEALRVDLGNAYRIVRARLVIACEDAGPKTYTIRGANEADFTDEVTLDSRSFTAAGAFDDQEVLFLWSTSASYRYFRLVGPAEVRRIHTLELYGAAGGEVIVTDPTTDEFAEVDAALAALWAAIEALGAPATALDDLTDVAIAVPALNDTLRFDGTTWVNDDRIWRPVMDGSGNVVVDSGTGHALMALA